MNQKGRKNYGSVAEALEAVRARAATDPEFRKRLLERPGPALRDEMGLELPDDLSVKFVEKDPGVDLMAVLPDPATDPEGRPRSEP